MAMLLDIVRLNHMPATTSNNIWDEARLLRLIQDKIEESADIEYKGAGALSRDKKEEITKDISAMANSAGGTIIYGMAEFTDTQRKHLPERIDPVDRTQFSKEWLEHIIGQIRPRISHLVIHPVQLSGGSNNVAYVVEVPQGTTAHQALTSKYHRRYNFEAVAMQDHEIRDVMNRFKAPRIEIELLPIAKDDGRQHVQYSMSAWILNSSEAVTAYEITIWVEQHPPNWIINATLWGRVNRIGPDGKYVFQFPLHPGDREIIATWTAADGNAPIVPYFGHGGHLMYKPDLSQATYSQPEYRFRLRIFARNQPVMDFDCLFSKNEMEKQILKRFQPAKTNL